ncbi:MAG: VWA domain-containing protein [Pyrinomonadaceae bacterium]|nr:VWA domain-containing protein [Pyrinomonadaceae bacterium]
MNKFAAALAIVSLIAVISFAQSGRKTRPRVVKNPKPAPTAPAENPSKRPAIKNDSSQKAVKNLPGLLDATTKKPPSSQTLVGSTPQTSNSESYEDDGGIIKIDTNLVALPVSVLDRNGRFVVGVDQSEFSVYDNGVEQTIEYFVTVEKPFTVVLLLDVSPSTHFEIEQIQRAAYTFVNQLRADDKVMVVAFDYGYQLLVQPTSDRNKIRDAIYRARFGYGTSLYEAVSNTIKRELNRVEGRKAVVLFTDGVDTSSSRASYRTTIKEVEEVDALFYPIRYNTYNSFVGGVRSTNRSNVRAGNNVGRRGATGAGTSRAEYSRGKSYLSALAHSSGGRIFEADTTANLDSAFRNIAEELRKQYWIGYYPEDVGRKGEIRNVRVRITRPNTVIRTKNKYIVGKGYKSPVRKGRTSEEPEFFD